MNLPKRKFSFLLLFLLSSILLADPALDLPDEFNSLNIDTVFKRGNESSSDKKEENKWRADEEPKEVDSSVRWGSISIYDNTVDPDPFHTKDSHSNKVIDIPESAPQLEIRF